MLLSLAFAEKLVAELTASRHGENDSDRVFPDSLGSLIPCKVHIMALTATATTMSYHCYWRKTVTLWYYFNICITC